MEIKRFLSGSMSALDFMEPELAFSRKDGLVCLDLEYGLRFDDDQDTNRFKSRDDHAWRTRSIAALEGLCRRFPER